MAGALRVSEGGVRDEAEWVGRGHASLPLSEMQAEPMQDVKLKRGVICRENGMKRGKSECLLCCPCSESWWWLPLGGDRSN